MVIKGKKISLTAQIFIAMLIGAVVGIAAPGVMISLGFLGDICQRTVFHQHVQDIY